MNKKLFKTRKELSAFLKEKNIDTADWSEEKWLSLSKSGAEIHIQALAEAMWDARNESEPRLLKAGEWHIPFGDQMDITINSPIVKAEAKKIIEPDLLPGFDYLPSFSIPTIDYQKLTNTIKVQIAVARCARLSYMTFDGEINYEKDIELFTMLLNSRHASPFEHVSRSLNEEEYNTLGKIILDPIKGYVFEKGWVDNFKGFISYRRILNF